MQLHKGDEIVVIRGKDRGKKAKIVRVIPREQKIVAEGVNLRKRHQRRRRSNEKGQIVTFAAPLASANVKLFCASCNEARRVKNVRAGSEKTRVCIACGTKI